MSVDAVKHAIPLVAVVSAVPLLVEAVEGALAGMAEVRSFPAGSGDTAGFLRFLKPDAVVVDSLEEAQQAISFARGAGATLVHVSLPDQRLRLLRAGGWIEYVNGSASPERLRSALAAGLLGKARSS
ncbi:MAG TPA: hypothetical protein VE693_03850 [Gaiellaceae bacterium]|jgi:hypothetical protein|nr:hypothetical protein [Gaiellaceae bacterium]